MLYDNAQLLPVYLDAYLLTKSPLFLATVQDIATYLTSAPMQSELGGIHSAEDADSLPTANDKHKREGAYYVWTLEEFKNLLSEEEVKVCTKYWNVKAEGNVERRHDIQGELIKQNTLCVSYETADLAKELDLAEDEVKRAIEGGRRKLLAYREANRPRPALDDKIVTSWNGLAIGGLARTSAALREISPPQHPPTSQQQSQQQPAFKPTSSPHRPAHSSESTAKDPVPPRFRRRLRLSHLRTPRPLRSNIRRLIPQIRRYFAEISE